MKQLTIIAVLLFAATTTEATQPFPRYANDPGCPHCAPMEFDRLVAMLGDDALRDIMCRLSSQRFTPGSLSSALGMPEGQVLRRIKTLQGWGLVRMVRRDSATTIVEPLPGEGTGTLRRWAVKYCPMGDECGRPAQGSEEGRDSAYNVRVAAMDMALLNVGNNLGNRPDYAAARKIMVEEIEDSMRINSVHTGRQALSGRVHDAFLEVPRHEFLKPELAHAAYQNLALPIGGGQRLPPPFIIALMTEFLDLQPNDTVLEVGTGTGYQTAILSRLAKRVQSIELVEVLFNEATERLKRLGNLNVETRNGNGFQGWPDNGQFNAILVGTHLEDIPDSLAKQLAPGGRLVAIGGGHSEIKQIIIAKKGLDGSIVQRNLLPIRHVSATDKN